MVPYWRLVRERRGRNMTDTQKILLIALAVVMALGLIVGGVLNHHIGGFIETVAREEEEARAREDEEATNGQGNR